MPSPSDNTALVVMDVQPAALDRISDKDAYLTRVRTSVEAARRKAVPIRFVVVGFRPGMPEVSPRNQVFGAYRKQASTMLVDPRPAITPRMATSSSPSAA